MGKIINEAKQWCILKDDGSMLYLHTDQKYIVDSEDKNNPPLFFTFKNIRSSKHGPILGIANMCLYGGDMVANPSCYHWKEEIYERIDTINQDYSHYDLMTYFDGK